MIIDYIIVNWSSQRNAPFFHVRKVWKKMSQILWNLGSSAEYQSSLSPDTQSTCWWTHRLILGWHVSGQSVNMLADILPNMSGRCGTCVRKYISHINTWLGVGQHVDTHTQWWNLVGIPVDKWSIRKVPRVIRIFEDCWWHMGRQLYILWFYCHTIKYKNTNQSIHTVQNV